MNSKELDTAMRNLAEQQHGVLARTQVRALGATNAHLRRRLDSPAWDALTSKVIRLAGSAETFFQRCMAATLDAGPGAVVSHETAAGLWRLPGFGESLIVVSRLDRKTSRPSLLALVHDVTRLPAHHLTTVAGIPITTVPRTIFDLAGAVHAHRAERALDNALARNLVSLDSLRRVTEELRRRGRSGSALMSELLAARPQSYVPPDTGLEARFAHILKLAGLPSPVRQRNLGGDAWVGRVDFLLPFSLVAEVDSSIHHSTKLDRAADAARDRELEAVGFRIVRVTDDEVWQRPDVVVDRVRAALAVAKAAWCRRQDTLKNVPTPEKARI